MHRLACIWSEAIQLHSIGSDEASGQSLIATTDGGRMSMWNLVRMELLFRLISGKTPSFSFDLSEWRVNLPSLFFDEVNLQEAVPTTAFLASIRVTLILIRFFQAIQEPDSQQDKLSPVISLCEQVEDTVVEWDLVGFAPFSGDKPSADTNASLAGNRVSREKLSTAGTSPNLHWAVTLPFSSCCEWSLDRNTIRWIYLQPPNKCLSAKK